MLSPSHPDSDFIPLEEKEGGFPLYIFDPSIANREPFAEDYSTPDMFDFQTEYLKQ